MMVVMMVMMMMMMIAIAPSLTFKALSAYISKTDGLRKYKHNCDL